MSIILWKNPSRAPRPAALASCAAAAIAAFTLTSAAFGGPPQSGDDGVLILKSGQVLTGKLERAGDRYLIPLSDGELRIRAADVEFVCRDLDEAYQHKRSRLNTDRTEEHLDLAEWCLRQYMLGHAADELSAAMRLDPRHPRLAITERRLEQVRNDSKAADGNAAEATKSDGGKKYAKAPDPAAVNDELDRLVRGLPAGVMESFTTTIQPLLVNSCTTSGCHGPRGNSSFQLQRLPLEHNVNPRLTQQNAQAVLAQINLQDPANSPLLTVPAKPHGNAKVAFFSGRQAGMYELLAAWIELAAKEDSNPAAGRLPASQAAMLQTLGAYGFNTAEEAPDAEPSAGSTAGRNRAPGITGRLIAERKAADKAEKAVHDADKNAANGSKPAKNSANKNGLSRPAVEPASPE